MIDTVGDADRYLVVAAAPDPLRQFYAGELDLRTLLLESSTDIWYTPLVDDNFERPVSLEPEQGSLLEMDYLSIFMVIRPAIFTDIQPPRERGELTNIRL